MGITEPLWLGQPPILRDQTMPVPIDDIDQRIAGFAEPSGCARDSCEDWLNVGRRTEGYGGSRGGLLLNLAVRGRVDRIRSI
jgi:hypothetical protein